MLFSASVAMIMFLFLYFVNVVNYTDRFLNVKTILHPWDKFHFLGHIIVLSFLYVAEFDL